MFRWYRELQTIRYEFRERRLALMEEAEAKKHLCPSCEVLKVQLERAHYEKEQLLNKILHPEPTPAPTIHEVLKPLTQHIPWRVRKQMLEAEDREKARAEREAPKSDVDELERELGVATAKRESETGIEH